MLANAGQPWPTLAGAERTWNPLDTLTVELCLQWAEKVPSRGPQRTQNGPQSQAKTLLGVHWARKDEFNEK